MFLLVILYMYFFLFAVKVIVRLFPIYGEGQMLTFKFDVFSGTFQTLK